MSAQVKIRELDQIQQTLNFPNAQRIKEQFQKINKDIGDLTALIFPNDPVMARDLVREEYTCETQ